LKIPSLASPSNFAQAQNKIERFELAFVPGLAITNRSQQRVPTVKLPESTDPDEAMGWYGPDGYLNRYIRQQEALEAKAKEIQHGVPIEGREEAVHESASGASA
jgi:hypothetical protein